MSRDLYLYEVGPRDGLQALPHTISVENRAKMVRTLADAGLRDIEVGSFVSPKKVPTMEDTAEVFHQCADIQANLAALVPNKRGMREAREAGVERFNIFFSADEAFNQRNLGKSRKQAIEEYHTMLFDVPPEKIRVYISMAFGEECPADAIADAAAFGGTVVLCDTNGRASPDTIRQVIGLSYAPTALHLHYSSDKEQMFNNISIAYDAGIREFDTSIAGLGGCPFVPGSRGNLGTGELIAWAEQEGLDCGVSLDDIQEAENLARILSKKEVTV